MKKKLRIFQISIGAILIMGLFSGLFGGQKNKMENNFQPGPEWEPKIVMPESEIINRFKYYTDNKKDFVVFRNGTCVIVSNNLTDDQAKSEAKEILAKIFNYHPDMNPLPMDDGNILIQYNHPAYNVVLDYIAVKNIELIKKNHQKALARDEVLITQLGPNKFEDFGMKALFGRCYFLWMPKSQLYLK